MSRYYNRTELYREKFYRIPKVFMTSEKYKGMSDSTKLAYAILLDRQELSVKNGWFDDSGNIYFIYTVAQLQDVLSKSNKTVVNIKKELVKAGLLEIKKHGQGSPDSLYLLRPEMTENDIYKIQNEETAATPEEIESTENDAETVGGVEKCKKYISRSVKSTLLEVKKVHPNNTDIKKTNIKKTNKSLSPNTEIKLLIESLAQAFDYSEREIKEILIRLEGLDLSFITKHDIRKQFLNMEKKNDIQMPAIYFANGLEAQNEANKRKKMQQDKNVPSETQKPTYEKIPFYNWLDEGAGADRSVSNKTQKEKEYEDKYGF